MIKLFFQKIPDAQIDQGGAEEENQEVVGQQSGKKNPDTGSNQNDAPVSASFTTSAIPSHFGTVLFGLFRLLLYYMQKVEDGAKKKTLTVVKVFFWNAFISRIQWHAVHE